jgi:predicted RNA-binding protein with RPS1 domain
MSDHKHSVPEAGQQFGPRPFAALSSAGLPPGNECGAGEPAAPPAAARVLPRKNRGRIDKEIADHISDTERNSADAERDSKDVKLFAFLKAQLASRQPPHYPALVTDVRNFGFFVDVPGLAMSGLVPLSTVADDFFVLDTQRNHLIGRRTRRMIRLGDKVEVQVAKVDTFKKQVDFRLSTVRRQSAVRPRGFGRSSTESLRKPTSRRWPTRK